MLTKIIKPKIQKIKTLKSIDFINNELENQWLKKLNNITSYSKYSSTTKIDRR